MTIRKWGDDWPFLSHHPQLAATADEAAWDQYFRLQLGGYPLSYRLFRDRHISYYNVPELEPERFDTSYTHGLIAPLTSLHQSYHEPGGSAEQREQFAQRVRDTLRELGFGFPDRKLAVLPPRTFRRFTDEELRSIYAAKPQS